MLLNLKGDLQTECAAVLVGKMHFCIDQVHSVKGNDSSKPSPTWNLTF